MWLLKNVIKRGVIIPKIFLQNNNKNQQRHNCVNQKPPIQEMQNQLLLRPNPPFTRTASYSTPIVGLRLALAANMTRNRAEATLTELGIKVDRDTIKNYCKLFRKRAEKYAGLSLLDT
jgi:hypothetical protein